MNIAIGSDHRGTDVLKRLVDVLELAGHTLTVHANENGETCDYPDPAFKVAMDVAEGRAERGILICGSGIGMSIAANKVTGVRAALVHDEVGAEVSRRHNDANILCLPADMLGFRILDRIVEKWLSTEFEGGRHARRIAKVAAIEQGIDPVSVTSADAVRR